MLTLCLRFPNNCASTLTHTHAHARTHRSLTALHDAADLDMWEAQRRRQELMEAAKKVRGHGGREAAVCV